MSRSYRFDLEVHGVLPGDADHIRAAVLDDGHWPGLVEHGDAWVDSDTLYASGDVTLYGGVGDDESAGRLARVITDAVARAVPLKIATTYLDDLPYDEYAYGPAVDDWPDPLPIPVAEPVA